MRQFFPATFRGLMVFTVLMVFGAAPARSEPPAAKNYANFTGRTEATEDVQIVPRVAGTLAKVAFQDGEHVERDQLLFELDPRPYEAAMDLARAQVARAKAEMEVAKAELNRTKQLAPSGAVTLADVERATSRAAETMAATTAAEAAMAHAQLDLMFTRIVSPIAGRAGRAAVSAGNWVQPGTVLTTVVSEDPIYVSFAVSEREYLQLARQWRRGGRNVSVKDLRIPIEVGLSDEKDFPRKGVLDSIGNQADPKTATIRFRAVLPNPDRLMIPGLFVRVRMPLSIPGSP